MNLQEFLNYKKECPICSSLLVTAFHSSKRQKHRYEDDRFLVLFDLNSIKKGQTTYKVGYSFGLKDNSFHIEFYTKDEIRFENETPLFLIDRFKLLDKNLTRSYKIYKHCGICNRYNYSSNEFVLNYKSCSTGDLSVHKEYAVMCRDTDNGCKVYKMLNYYSSNETWLNYGKSRSSLDCDNVSLDFPGMIKTGIIPFTTHDETIERLKLLITFS